jgi:Xaa-Pro dipeptidase
MSLPLLYAAHHQRLVTEYAHLLTHYGLDAVVIHSGTALKRTAYDDQYFALRPTPHFQHWLALAEPDVLVIAFADGRTPRLIWPSGRDFWERPRAATIDHAVTCFEVQRPPVSLREHVPGGRTQWLGEDRARGAALGLEDQVSAQLLADLDALRVHKSAYEVHCLREANVLAARGHAAVAAQFDAGDHSELDLHLAYLRATMQDDPETPYKNIVAYGDNASILHHVGYGRERSHAPSLLVDAGATFQGYCSDITRTWVRGHGAAIDAFAHLIAGIEASQLRLCDLARAGTDYEALHDEALRDVAALLAHTGLVRASAEEIDARGISRKFLPHGLGHSLGLQCHDVGCALRKPKAENPFLRNTRTIDEGQCFTIEPGIYFIDVLLEELRASPAGGLVDWAQVAALAPMGGIRIEDDLLATAEGAPLNLTRAHLPRGGGHHASTMSTVGD